MHRGRCGSYGTRAGDERVAALVALVFRRLLDEAGRSDLKHPYRA
jgi:hypothetical protein